MLPHAGVFPEIQVIGPTFTLLKANQARIFCHPFWTIIRTVNSIEDIKDNDDKVLFFNGLSDCDTHKALFDGVIQQEQTKLFWILLV